MIDEFMFGIYIHIIEYMKPIEIDAGQRSFKVDMG